MKIIQRLVMMLISIAVLIFTFNLNYTTLIKEFESTAKSKEAAVNQYIEISSSFIELMSVYGDNYFKSIENKNSSLYSLLEYDPALNCYNLDAVGGTKYEPTTGNLTGLGKISESDIIRTEINLALEYNKYFSTFYNRLPDVTWLYYTSKNNFINMYPWISSKDFVFTEKLKTFDFYTFANSQNNALRQAVWTPAYLDEAGKGLMVTLSIPVYNDDTFMGVVSVDLTTARLGKLIDSDYKSYLIDAQDLVIATSRNIVFDQKEMKLSTLLSLDQSVIEEMKTIRNDSFQKVGNYYIYLVEFENTPWKMFLIVPVWEFVEKSVLYTFPILTICALLYWTFSENEKHRRTAVMLTNSLEEIKSYHDLLENAAKYDFLTNTYNRRGLEENFYRNTDSNNTTKVPVSFIMGDIDKFKFFNDTFGHTAGDRILVEITTLMKNNIGKNDLVCRWGGEEFVIMLVNKTCENAFLIAEKIRKEIEATYIFGADDVELRATMTFGVAEYEYGETMDKSIAKADSALYLGKKQGRNRVVSYEAVKQSENRK